MRELLVLLFIIAAIAIIWYLWKRNAAAAPPPVSAARADSAPSAARGSGLLRKAGDTAAGARYEKATGQMEEITADLAAARREADRAAERLAERADEALATVQAATDGGGVPGDGTPNCPPNYPIKGNRSSMLYHEPGTPTYLATIPELCFSSAEAAQAAGFSSTEH